MTLPGFRAETSIYGSSMTYVGGPATQAGHVESLVMLAADSCVCTSPNCTWSCPLPPPPDCTTTGCRRGQVCCDCVDPPRCTSPILCNRLCRL
jgi:hypothetical protein